MSQRLDSVWDAIEERPALAEKLKLRSALMRELEKHITQQGLTQAVAAKKFGVTQPRISDLMRGHIEVFSIDMLVNMLSSAGLRMKLNVSKAAA